MIKWKVRQLRDSDLAQGFRLTGSRPWVLFRGDQQIGIFGDRYKATEHAYRCAAVADLDDMALAIVLAAKDKPDRTHSQLCPVWTQSQHGTVVVPLTKCNCWRREFWMSVVRDVRDAGWTPPGV